MVPPRATYRLQFRGGVDFDTVAGLADYLEALGVSHVYASPILRASPGSTHGYDVVDPTRPDPALGGEPALARMTSALAALGLGILLDIVPNHLATGPANPWWWDVLENGPASLHAASFDIEWTDRLLLPVLPGRYGELVHRGAIAIARHGGTFEVRAGDLVLPAAPRSIGGMLAGIAAARGHDELGFLADALTDLPAPTPGDHATTHRGHRDKAVVLALLARLFARDPDLAAAVDAVLAATSANPTELDGFLERQNWRLAYWRIASTDLGYRRFFDVTALCGVRVEDPAVFFATHRLVLGWLAEGRIDGFRVDHVDGLRDPRGYLDRLRAAAPHAWIVVEKILAPGETLPSSWPVAGTTGYDFMRLCDQAFVAQGAEPVLRGLWRDLGAEEVAWDAATRAARLQIIDESFAADRDRLVEIALGNATLRAEFRDVSRRELRDALTELLACFPVYRTYRTYGPALEPERAYIEAAIARATQLRPTIDAQVWLYLRDALTGPGQADELVARFQQLTPAVMAKGVEDTAGYRHAWFPLLDDVGGAPDRFGIALDELHAGLAALPARGLLATMTHDAKRGEDVRARLAAISERPERWAAAVLRWRSRAERHGEVAPALAVVWWYTLVGAWPLGPDRAVAYLVKAAREAKQETSWLRPDPAYEHALEAFVRGVLGDVELVAEIERFVDELAPAALRISLARTLLKLTVPGIPDFYQGCESWDTSLVDPDNRRPVDFALRRQALRRAQRLDAAGARAADAATAKTWLVWRVLALRRRCPEVFELPYRPLEVTGPGRDRVIAYARGEQLAVILPRGGDAGAGTTVALPPGVGYDVLGERRLSSTGVRELWASFPMALVTT